MVVGGQFVKKEGDWKVAMLVKKKKKESLKVEAGQLSC